MIDNRQINGKEILPKKEGERVLIYPACGTDNDWIKFLNPDVFIGIDRVKFDNNPFDILGCRTKAILYDKTDAIIPPPIPKADEIVLLLKRFDWMRLPDCCFSRPGHYSSWSELTQELWEGYQKENLTSLKRYLNKCEESASKRVFVIDLDGYEISIVPHGYKKLLSLTPTIDCRTLYDFCGSRPCERSMALFNWDEIKKHMPGYACLAATRTELVKDEGLITKAYEVTLPILITYVKEK